MALSWHSWHCVRGLVTIAGAIAIGLTLPVFNRYRRQPDPPPVAGLHSVTPAKA